MRPSQGARRLLPAGSISRQPVGRSLAGDRISISLDVSVGHAQYVNVSYIHMRSTMSGWANQGTYSNTGSPWGPGAQPGWNPPEDAWRCWHAARPLWIAAMILGFIFWWPVGLTLLFLGIWGKRMAFGGCGG